MTREEAIKILEIIDMRFTTLDVVERQALVMAIKALEQELCDVPDINVGNINCILDKIRAEIEQERIGYPPSADYYKAIMKCLQIIDKYKESEDSV